MAWGYTVAALLVIYVIFIKSLGFRMHIEAITRWTSAWGSCLHILWSNHQVSAGYFPPLDLSHITHTAGSLFMLYAERRGQRKTPLDCFFLLLFLLLCFRVHIGQWNLNQTNIRMKENAKEYTLAVWEYEMIKKEDFFSPSNLIPFPKVMYAYSNNGWSVLLMNSSSSFWQILLTFT